MRKGHLAVLCLLLAQQAFAVDFYTTTVAKGAVTFNYSGGEVHLAVVPPDTKKQCPNGRVVISDDWRRPPLAKGDSPSFHPEVASLTADVAHWRSLSGPKNLKTGIPLFGISEFLPPPPVKVPGARPRAHRWGIWGADHQFIALPNGDLVYQRVTVTREPMTPEPRWAEFTFLSLGFGFFGPNEVINFGPGARTTNTTWRSTDCGVTFEYVGEIDSYGRQHEDCASPQALKDDLPNWSMGGTDNPNLVADRETGAAYALIPCFGRHLDPRQDKLADFVDTTYVYSWDGKSIPDDEKKLFKLRGSFKPGIWGAPAVVVSPTRLIVAINDTIKVADAESGTFTFPDTGDKPENADWGWSGDVDSPPAEYLSLIDGNIHGSALLAHMPGNDGAVLFGFNSSIDGVNGFRVFRYDPDRAPSERFKEIETILPPAANAAVIHLTAADPGDNGPVLLYWTELTTDGSDKKATVRGTVVFDEVNRAPVTITLSPFTLTPPATGKAAYFLGDYHTSGAFKISKGNGIDVYHYFPAWAQPWTTPKSAGDPGGSVHYREVTVTRQKLIDPIVVDKKTKQPPFAILGECCDFIPLIEKLDRERGLGNLTAANARTDDERLTFALVNALLAADPNLRERSLRTTGRRAAEGRVVRAVRAPATTIPPAARKSVKEHQRKTP